PRKPSRWPMPSPIRRSSRRPSLLQTRTWAASCAPSATPASPIWTSPACACGWATCWWPRTAAAIPTIAKKTGSASCRRPKSWCACRWAADKPARPSTPATSPTNTCPSTRITAPDGNRLRRSPGGACRRHACSWPGPVPGLYLFGHALDQRDHRQDQEHEEQDLGDRSRASGDAAKTQDGGHDGHDEKDNGVVKHTTLLVTAAAGGHVALTALMTPRPGRGRRRPPR